MADTPEFLSPRLQQLNDALQNGDSTALEAFWQE